MCALTINYFTGAGAFTDLAAEWAQLEKEQGILPNFDLESLRFWWEQLTAMQHPRLGTDPGLIVARIARDGKTAAILPMLKKQRKIFKGIRITILEFLSQSFGGPVMDLVGGPMNEDEITELMADLEGNIRFDFLTFSYLTAHSSLYKAYKSRCHIHSAWLEIPIHDDYQEIRKSVYSKNLRHVLNKFHRRLIEYDGEIEGTVITDKSGIRDLYEKISQVSLSKLEEEGMHSLYSDDRLGRFYFDALLNKEQVYCSYFSGNGHFLAYNLGFILDDTVYALDAAYDRTFEKAQKIGLGILAYDQVVKHFAGKYSIVNMGHGTGFYKFRFTKQYKLTYSLLIPGRSLKAWLLLPRITKRLRRSSENVMNTLKKGIGHPVPDHL